MRDHRREFISLGKGKVNFSFQEHWLHELLDAAAPRRGWCAELQLAHIASSMQAGVAMQRWLQQLSESANIRLSVPKISLKSIIHILCIKHW